MSGASRASTSAAWLSERYGALWQEVKHPEHKQFSVAEMLEHERLQLMPMPATFDGCVDEVAGMSSTCLVSVVRNRYSVPCELDGQMVSTHLYSTRVTVVVGDGVVVEHERLADKGKRATTGSTTSHWCRGRPCPVIQGVKGPAHYRSANS